MKTVRKYTKGKRKGFNIRRVNSGEYVIFYGSMSQFLFGFETIEEAQTQIDKLFIV